MAHYLDTSALVKLVAHERETPALLAWLAETDRTPVTSDLARTELVRASRRISPALTVAARDALDTVTILRLPTTILEHAALLDPPSLRSLDAVHLAAALTLGDDLESVVTYDDRLADAAEASGIRVIAPR